MSSVANAAACGARCGIDALLPAVRSLGAQRMALGAPENPDRLEVRRLEEHVRRLLRHLGVEPAHDPGEGDCALGVRDHEVGRVELSRIAVEGRELLAVPRTANDDAPAGERVEIEDVQWIAERVHDVVRHVDDVRDRPHARRHEPRLEPERRGRDHARRGRGARCSAGSPRSPRSSRRQARPLRARDPCPAEARAPGRRAPRPRGRCRRRTGDRAGSASSPARGRCRASGSTSASGVPGSSGSASTRIPVWSWPELELALGEDHPVRDASRGASRAPASARPGARRPGARPPPSRPRRSSTRRRRSGAARPPPRRRGRAAAGRRSDACRPRRRARPGRGRGCRRRRATPRWWIASTAAVAVPIWSASSSTGTSSGT